MIKNYYAILNISNNSNKAEIVKSFRELAKKYHPDKNSAPNTSEIFIDIFEAYEVLKNIEKRKVYDVYWSKKYKIQDVTNINHFNKTFNKQRENAKHTAEKYANMPYEKFINSIVFVVKKSSSFGSIILLFCLGLSFLFFSLYFFTINTEQGVGVFIGLFSVIIAFSLFAVSISDWNKLMSDKNQ